MILSFIYNRLVCYCYYYTQNYDYPRNKLNKFFAALIVSFAYRSRERIEPNLSGSGSVRFDWKKAPLIFLERIVNESLGAHFPLLIRPRPLSLKLLFENNISRKKAVELKQKKKTMLFVWVKHCCNFSM
jgi:hypothetical protein